MIVNLRKTFLTNSTVQCLHLLSSVSQNRNFSLLWDLVACIKPKVRLKQTISMSHILQALTMVSKNHKNFVIKIKLNHTISSSKYMQTFEKNLAYIVHSNALSFYGSQNVLGWSKFFVQDQKFIYILWQLQTFCARQKEDLHSVKLFFVSAQKFLNRH